SPKDDEGKDDEGKDDEGKDDAGTDEEGGADDGAEDAADDDDAPVAKSPAEVKVIALQLQEGVLKLKMRLLYLTVHRAVLRAQLYAAALKLAKEEARGASDVAARYQSELNRMRRERQLERLEYEETKLDLLLTDATSRASDPKHENRPLWLHWQQALESLKSVNRLTKEAVRLRRSFEARVSPNQAGMDDAPVDPGEGAVDVLRRFRRPGRVAFDVKYVEDAREAARSQDFDRALVARHHEVVSDRIASLDEALVLVAKDHGLAAGLEREVAAAEKALSDLETAAGKLADQGDRTNWLETVSETRREDFDTTRKAFEETLRGLDEKAQEARTLRDACLAFERELKLLGPRSFGIRVQRNLDGDNLGHAFQDAQDSVEDAGRWIAGRSEDNLATFVGTHWLMLLACVALVVAGVFFVRFARRGLDLAINRAARTVPELRFEPVTVRAEEAHAAREKAENEQAAKEAEAEALRMVSKEEAGKAQKMGEGGYGGGDE
ncbi:MAG: hypothetical protein P1V36_09075, partial [Planctomycetota bacterium]|nr:hypothetical protein [Planctomycetota bacterium]